MNNIENLTKQFKSFQESDPIKNYMQLLNICDALLNDFPNALRQEPFYSFTLDVINQLIELRIEIGSRKMYEGSDLDAEIVIREMNLLKSVVPEDEKMQKIIKTMKEWKETLVKSSESKRIMPATMKKVIGLALTPALENERLAIVFSHVLSSSMRRRRRI